MTSPEPLSPARIHRLQPVRTVARTTTALLVTVCAANVFATWSTWNSYWVADDYATGAPGVGVAALVGADNLTTSAMWLTLLAMAAAATALLTWVWRTRVNAEQLSSVRHRLTRGWTIGGWFCPIVNLWFPRHIIDDIWRASRPDGQGREQSGLVRAWWYTLLANGLLSVVARVETSGPLTIETLKTVATYNTVSTVIVGVAAVLLIQVIRQITEWQSIPRESHPTSR